MPGNEIPRHIVPAARAASRKPVIMFDLDGTLASSKSVMDREMRALFCRLLARKTVVVAGGGSFEQFHKQMLRGLRCPPAALKDLLLQPTSGAAMYRRHRGAWSKIYSRVFTPAQKIRIFKAFDAALKDIKYEHRPLPGIVYVEDRGSQVTFSALGQSATLSAKEAWRRTSDMRPRLRRALMARLPGFNVRIAGTTSVDVTRKGIDKAYGVRQVMRLMRVGRKDIVYVGDALFAGGNDQAVKKTGIATVRVRGPEDTKRFIRALLAALPPA